MASTAITSMVFLLSLLHAAFSQDFSSPGTTAARCTPSLLPLVSCVPFVQGSVQLPAQQCCNSLGQLYSNQPHCLCLLLSNTTVSPYPINSTLALQLPDLCALQVDASTCSGTTTSPPSHPPSSPVSLGRQPNPSTSSNSTVAASPMLTVTPKPNIIGLGFHNSGCQQLRMKEDSKVLVLVAIFLLRKLLT